MCVKCIIIESIRKCATGLFRNIFLTEKTPVYFILWLDTVLTSTTAFNDAVDTSYQHTKHESAYITSYQHRKKNECAYITSQ